MKRWALLVVLLYGLALAALSWPLTSIVLGQSDRSAFLEPANWLVAGVFMLCQAALLLVPVRVTGQRPVARRTLLLPLGASGFLVGLLVVGLLFSLCETFLEGYGGQWVFWALFGLPVATWAVWTVVFYRLARGPISADVITRQCRLLLKGSILELLVAVPMHIVVRQRDYCCAGFMTFCGIVCGVAVMLLSFGPGVFFLFVDRWKRLHPQSPENATRPTL